MPELQNVISLTRYTRFRHRYARALFDVALKESDPVRDGRDFASFAGPDVVERRALHGALTNPARAGAGKRADRRHADDAAGASPRPCTSFWLLAR